MAVQDHNGDEQPSRAGYFAAIFASALGHAAIFALAFFVAPHYLHAPDAPPPAYTVKIVDDIPAGDLGMHLPRLTRQNKSDSAPPKVEEPKIKVEPPKEELAPDADPNAIALNTKKVEVTTPTPTPVPTPQPTPEPTLEPTPKPAPRPTHTPKPHPSPKAAQQPAKRGKPKNAPTIAVAKAESTPSVEARLATLKRGLLAEHLKDRARHHVSDDDIGDDMPAAAVDGSRGGGPVAGRVATAGRGMGIGPGTGSMGIQQDPDFLLYYQTVQDQIKKSWSFIGGSNDLTASVDFAIGPDGALTAVKIGKSSNDSAFDDSVIRAIRRAAPFPPPPDKFRDRFAAGVEALFKLGELKS